MHHRAGVLLLHALAAQPGAHQPAAILTVIEIVVQGGKEDLEATEDVGHQVDDGGVHCEPKARRAGQPEDESCHASADVELAAQPYAPEPQQSQQLPELAQAQQQQQLRLPTALIVRLREANEPVERK